MGVPYTLDEGVTQGMLQSFLACRRRSQLSLEEWEYPEEHRALDWGTLIHSLLERYYKTLNTGKPVTPETILRKTLKEYQQKQAERGCNLEWIEEDMAMARGIFPGYLRRWRGDDASKHWVSLELIFDVMWEGFRQRGKTDGVFEVQKRGHPGLWILETKTFSRDDDALVDTLNYDFQNLFYVHCMEILLKRPVVGVLYNRIRRPGLRKGTLQERVERIQLETGDNPDHYYERFEVSYPPERLKSFRAELLMKLVEFRKWVGGELPTYKNEGSCRGKFPCPFIPVCSSESIVGCTQTATRFRELTEGE